MEYFGPCNLGLSLFIICAFPHVADAHSPADPDTVLPHGHTDTIMKFSYDDNDELGPSVWNNRSIVNSDDADGNEGKTINHCKSQWVTPLNIDTQTVVAPEEDLIPIADDMGDRSSLTFFIPTSHIENLEWEFGHASDSYHGLEIRSPHWGTFQLNDRYDPVGLYPEFEWIGANQFTNYDFSFGALFYCDPAKASPERSMHQIDRKKFPLEIDLVFFNQPTKIGIDTVVCDDREDDGCKTIGIVVAILGEFGEEDNKRLDPMIQAAATYDGPDWGTDDMDEGYVIPIKNPWSPSWIIPDSSAYYYYDSGSFPVPPCWLVGRVYVIKERIKISRRQFNLLTSVRTKREKSTGGRMPCTYSVIQSMNGDDDIEVKYNQYEYTIKGEDGRPMTDEDTKRKTARDKAAKEARRKSLARKGIYVEEKEDDSKSSVTIYFPISFSEMIFFIIILKMYTNIF